MGERVLAGGYKQQSRPHLCTSASRPGSCEQDIPPRRCHDEGGAPAAGGPPPASGSEGSPRPGVPHRNGRRDDSLRTRIGSNQHNLLARIVIEVRINLGGDPHCGRRCPEGRGPPRRPPHTGPGGAEAQMDMRCTGTPRGPSRRRKSCGRLREQIAKKM